MKRIKKTALVTGGAGFIGTNLVAKLISLGWQVTVFDNLYRQGAEKNLAWLKHNFGTKNLRVVIGDIRDYRAVKTQVKQVEVVFHLAAQTAVTTSIKSPREDFEINALGSFNVLEAARTAKTKPIVLYSSTNKVYGALADLKIALKGKRYVLIGKPEGVDETTPLDFQSPYGCSHGVGDQYARDYYRIYGLPTVVFRQSCIYGPRQLGVSDQGWVAHFVISGLKDKPITICGDGKQVRDLLYVDDLIELYLKAVARIKQVAGEVYNIGGGRKNAVSVLEVIRLIERLEKRKISLRYEDWRPGDQRVFIADNRKAKKELDWQPKTGIKEGLLNLIEWVKNEP